MNDLWTPKIVFEKKKKKCTCIDLPIFFPHHFATFFFNLNRWMGKIQAPVRENQASSLKFQSTNPNTVDSQKSASLKSVNAWNLHIILDVNSETYN